MLDTKRSASIILQSPVAVLAMRYKFIIQSTNGAQIEQPGPNQRYPDNSSKLPGAELESLKASQEQPAFVSNRRKRRYTTVPAENQCEDTITVESFPRARQRPPPKKGRSPLKENAVHIEKRRRLSPMVSDAPEGVEDHPNFQTAELDTSEENAPVTTQQPGPVFEHMLPLQTNHEKTAVQFEETDEVHLQTHCLRSWPPDVTEEEQREESSQQMSTPNDVITELDKLKSENAAMHSIVPHLRQKILDLSIERDKLRDQIVTLSGGTISRKNSAASTKNQSTQTDDTEQEEKNFHDLEQHISEMPSQSQQQVHAPELQVGEKSNKFELRVHELERELTERESELKQRIHTFELQLSEERKEFERRVHDSEMQLLERINDSDQRVHELKTQLGETVNLSEHLTITQGRAVTSHQQARQLSEGLIRKLKEKLMTYRKQQQAVQASWNEMENQLEMAYQAKEAIQADLNETRNKLATLQGEKLQHRDQKQLLLLMSKQDARAPAKLAEVQSLLTQAEQKLCARAADGNNPTPEMTRTTYSVQDLQGTEPRLSLEDNTVKELRRKLHLAEERNAELDIARNAMALELACSKKLVESLKQQDKDEEASDPRRTIESDLLHYKLMLENMKQKNQGIKEENRTLAWKVYDMERQLENNPEEFNLFREMNENIMTILEKFMSEVERNGTKPLIERVNTLRLDISKATEMPSSDDTKPADERLNLEWAAKLKAVQQEKQMIFQVIGKLQPGIVTRYNDLLCLDLNALEDAIAHIHQRNNSRTSKSDEAEISRLRQSVLDLYNEQITVRTAHEEEIAGLRQKNHELHNLKAQMSEQYRASMEEISLLRAQLVFRVDQRTPANERLGAFAQLGTPRTNSGGYGLGTNILPKPTMPLSPPNSLQNTQGLHLVPNAVVEETRLQ